MEWNHDCSKSLINIPRFSVIKLPSWSDLEEKLYVCVSLGIRDCGCWADVQAQMTHFLIVIMIMRGRGFKKKQAIKCTYSGQPQPQPRLYTFFCHCPVHVLILFIGNSSPYRSLSTCFVCSVPLWQVLVLTNKSLFITSFSLMLSICCHGGTEQMGSSKAHGCDRVWKCNFNVIKWVSQMTNRPKSWGWQMLTYRWFAVSRRE